MQLVFQSSYSFLILSDKSLPRSAHYVSLIDSVKKFEEEVVVLRLTDSQGYSVAFGENNYKEGFTKNKQLILILLCLER